jgi:ATP-dependent helicase HrpB
VAGRLAKAVPATPSAGPEWSCGALLSLAYPDRIAQRRPESHGRFLMASGREVVLPVEDALAAEDYLVVPALDAGATQGRAWLAAPCAVEELAALHADRIRRETRTWWEASREAVVARRETRLGALVLASQPVAIEDRSVASRLLLEAIGHRGLACLQWSDAARTLQARVETLRTLGVAGEWPVLSDERLRSDLDAWLAPWVDGMTRLSEARQIDLRQVLHAVLPWHLHQRLDEFAPERHVTPAGTRRRIAYHLDGPPVLAVPIQEMYGTASTPTIAQGRQPLLLYLLSPAGRPLQVTRDLASFWADGYVEVRKTMRGRYPKHHWPEDPRTAQATVAGRKPRS